MRPTILRSAKRTVTGSNATPTSGGGRLKPPPQLIRPPSSAQSRQPPNSPSSSSASLLPKPISSSLASTAQAASQHHPQSSIINGLEPNGQAVGQEKVTPATNNKSLLKSYKDLSPGNKLLLGGVLALFAGITYLLDGLVPEVEDEPVETVFDRRQGDKPVSTHQV